MHILEVEMYRWSLECGSLAQTLLSMADLVTSWAPLTIQM